MSKLPKVAIVLMLLSVTSASAQESSGYVELPRFRQVNEKLYRGAQPRDGGLARLQQLGIDTVINLRGTSARTRSEEAKARALGLNYYNVALPNWGRPQDTRVSRILEIITAPESGRVLIHCKDGVDRTGMIVAIHRMTQEGWRTDDALAEAERHGLRRIQFWMRDYAEDYGDRVNKTGAGNALQSKEDDEDLSDRIGAGMRVAEREVFRARKIGRRFLRRIPSL